jgi:multidrug efflux system membrane fusion protein
MYYGDIEVGGKSAETDTSKPIAERNQETANETFKVSYVTLNPESRSKIVNLRGRTKEDAIVPVRAETSGVLEKRLVNRGDYVEKDQLVCVIARGARESNLESTKARLAQMEADFEANKALIKKGFATDSRLREITFDLNAARAQMKQAALELSYTEIRTNAAGIVQDPIAEPGDVIAMGGTCITLVDRDPMFFTGQLSEIDNNAVKPGMKAKVSLVTGLTTAGTITYIAPSADPQTRTFLTDIRLDEAKDEIQGGLTASASIQLAESSAFRISPSWLTLEENGTIGVKTITDENKVQFTPVKILSQTKNGFWVEGLVPGSRVITMGQEYVISDEQVEPVLDERLISGAQG